MIYNIPNRYSQQLTRFVLYFVLIFLVANMLRAFINCGPWARDETRKSCSINQPPRVTVIGTAEEPVPMPLPVTKAPATKPKEEWISIRLSDGVLTVRNEIKAAPGDRYITIARIQPGDVVEILEREMGWIKIRMLEPIMDHWSGWVKGEFVEDETPEEEDPKE